MNDYQAPAGQSYGSSPKRFTRSSSDKWIAGVCSGIAHYFGIDPALVRVLFALSILLPGPQFLVYLVLWLAMPAN